MIPGAFSSPDGRPLGPGLGITVENIGDPAHEWAFAAGANIAVAAYVIDEHVDITGTPPARVLGLAQHFAGVIIAGHSCPLGTASVHAYLDTDHDLPGILEELRTGQAAGAIDVDEAIRQLTTYPEATLVLVGAAVMPGYLPPGLEVDPSPKVTP